MCCGTVGSIFYFCVYHTLTCEPLFALHISKLLSNSTDVLATFSEETAFYTSRSFNRYNCSVSIHPSGNLAGALPVDTKAP